jgi:hypothetical protein
MGARRIVEPTVEPLTLDEARQHVQIVETWQDLRLTDAIRGARDQVERYCQRALLTQTWELRLGSPLATGGGARLGAGWGRPGVTRSHEDDFVRNLVTTRDGSPVPLVTTWRGDPGCVIRLPWAAPLQAIDNIWVDGAQLTTDAYAVDTVEPAAVWLVTGGEFIRVEYRCGVTDPALVPPSIKEAVYVLTGTAFAWREAGGLEPAASVTQMPLAVQQRLDAFVLAMVA